MWKFSAGECLQDWLLIGLSVLIFKAQVSSTNLGGYLIAFGGKMALAASSSRMRVETLCDHDSGGSVLIDIKVGFAWLKKQDGHSAEYHYFLPIRLWCVLENLNKDTHSTAKPAAHIVDPWCYYIWRCACWSARCSCSRQMLVTERSTQSSIMTHEVCVGVVFFNYTKLQAMKAKQKEEGAQKATEDVENLHLVRTTAGSDKWLCYHLSTEPVAKRMTRMISNRCSDLKSMQSVSILVS